MENTKSRVFAKLDEIKELSKEVKQNLKSQHRNNRWLIDFYVRSLEEMQDFKEDKFMEAAAHTEKLLLNMKEE